MFLLEGHRGAIRALCYRPDGSQLVSAAEDGQLFLWDLKSPENPVRQYKTNPGDEPISIETVCWTLGGSLIAGDASGTLMRFRPDSDRIGARIGTQPAGLRQIGELREGKTSVLLTCSWSGRFASHSVDSLKQLEVTAIRSPAMSIATSGDRTIALIAMQDGSVRRLSPSGWQENRFVTDGRGVQAIACDLLVRHIVLADRAGTLFVYQTGPQVPELVMRLPLSAAIYGLAFTPNGQRLISGGADGTVRIWDVHTGEQLHVFEWHRKWVTCLAMSPDGTTVATGSEDSTIAVWDLPD